jgi:indole-3-glycerol phosphate synthase
MTDPGYATRRGMAQRRFSHAIAEGDGISVIAAVEDADSARAAEQQRAEALVVRGDPTAIRAASALPILWRAQVDLEQAAAVADAVMLVFDALDEEDGRLEELHERALELGLDCAVEVRDEEEIEQALERIDPEIFLLSPVEREDDETPLEVVLDLLAAVPAGKLAIADLPLTTPEEMDELERAGCDGVIVHGHEVAALLGGPPPLEV